MDTYGINIVGSWSQQHTWIYSWSWQSVMLFVIASAPIGHKAASDLEIFYSLHLPFQSGRRIFLKIPPQVFYEIREVSRKSMTTETCFLLYLFDVFLTWSTSCYFFIAKWSNLAILHRCFIWGSRFSWPFWSFSTWKLNIKLTQTGICWSLWCQVFSYTSTVLLTGRDT